MTTQSYPVVLERSLPPPHRRLLRGFWRDVTDLPVPDPGAIMLFRLGDRYEQWQRDRYPSATDPLVVNASGVSIVDVRERLVQVHVYLPSASPADEFTVRVGFRCRATKPEAVAKASLTDVDMALAYHLRGDQQLMWIGTKFMVEAINEVRREVDARVRAYCAMGLPRLSGLDVELATVEVPTPTDLKAQSRRIRDEQWRQAYEGQVREFEEEYAHRLADLLKGGGDEAAALGIARGDVQVTELLEKVRDAEKRVESRLMELVNLLADKGHLDRAMVDLRMIVDALMQRAGSSPVVVTPPPPPGEEDELVG